MLPELAAREWSVRQTLPARGYRDVLRALPATWRADAVFLNGLATQHMVAPLRVAMCPAVLRVDQPLGGPPTAWQAQGSWKVLRGVVTDSEHSARECLAAGAPPGLVHVVAPPAWGGGEPPSPADRAPGQRVGFVGALEPRTGVAALIEAAGRFLAERPEATLTLMGEAPPGDDGHAQLLPAAARATGVSERIEFEGRTEDRVAWLAELDVVVVPSLADPFGMPAAEAAAAGVAVVASRTGGLLEIVEDGRTGLLVPPGDVGTLAEAVGALLDDPSRRAELGGEARRRALERFSPAGYAERVDELLADAVS